MSRKTPAIVVIGATGYTGRLIARELSRADSPFVLAARDADRLERLSVDLAEAPSRLVDVTDPESLRRLIRRGDAVINTAGPFTELGELVIAACIERRAHYLDTTGEQPFMRAVYRRHHDAARAAGVAVVNAMAFEYALGDCAIAVAAEGLDQPLRSIDVIYAWSGAASSRGSRRTALRMIGRRGWTRHQGAFRREPPGARRRMVRLADAAPVHAVAFAAGEIVTAPRHLGVEDARGWLVLDPRLARLAPFLAPALPVIVPLLRPILEPIATRAPDPSERERRDSRFTIRVELVDRNGRERALEVHGTDPYGLTAAIAARAARRAMTAEVPAGVLAPARLVEPGPFLASLRDHGVALVDDPPD